VGIVLDGGCGSFLVCLVVLEWVGWLGNSGLCCTIGGGSGSKRLSLRCE